MNHIKPKRSFLDKASLYFFRGIVYMVLFCLVALILFIFYTLIINSTRTHNDIQKGFSMFPGNSFITNFKNLLNDHNMFVLSGLKNSFIIAFSTAILTTYFSALAAYGIHMYKFKGRMFIYFFMLAVIMVPSSIASIGLVTMLYAVKWTDNFWVIIIPAIASPTTFFFMKQYLESTLPKEIVEAARVDGSSEFRTFNQIVIPVLKPALAVQFIFSFVASWNNLFLPGLIIQSSDKRTVPIIISLLGNSDPRTFDLGKIYVLMLLAIIPMLIIYLIFSKKIIKGVTLGSVKG